MDDHVKSAVEALRCFNDLNLSERDALTAEQREELERIHGYLMPASSRMQSLIRCLWAATISEWVEPEDVAGALWEASELAALHEAAIDAYLRAGEMLAAAERRAGAGGGLANGQPPQWSAGESKVAGGES